MPITIGKGGGGSGGGGGTVRGGTGSIETFSRGSARIDSGVADGRLDLEITPSSTAESLARDSKSDYGITGVVVGDAAAGDRANVQLVRKDVSFVPEVVTPHNRVATTTLAADVEVGDTEIEVADIGTAQPEDRLKIGDTGEQHIIASIDGTTITLRERHELVIARSTLRLSIPENATSFIVNGGIDQVRPGDAIVFRVGGQSGTVGQVQSVERNTVFPTTPIQLAYHRDTEVEFTRVSGVVVAHSSGEAVLIDRAIDNTLARGIAYERTGRETSVYVENSPLFGVGDIFVHANGRRRILGRDNGQFNQNYVPAGYIQLFLSSGITIAREDPYSIVRHAEKDVIEQNEIRTAITAPVDAVEPIEGIERVEGLPRREANVSFDSQIGGSTASIGFVLAHPSLRGTAGNGFYIRYERGGSHVTNPLVRNAVHNGELVGVIIEVAPSSTILFMSELQTALNGAQYQAQRIFSDAITVGTITNRGWPNPTDGSAPTLGTFANGRDRTPAVPRVNATGIIAAQSRRIEFTLGHSDVEGAAGNNFPFIIDPVDQVIEPTGIADHENGELFRVRVQANQNDSAITLQQIFDATHELEYDGERVFSRVTGHGNLDLGTVDINPERRITTTAFAGGVDEIFTIEGRDAVEGSPAMPGSTTVEVPVSSLSSPAIQETFATLRIPARRSRISARLQSDAPTTSFITLDWVHPSLALNPNLANQLSFTINVNAGSNGDTFTSSSGTTAGVILNFDVPEPTMAAIATRLRAVEREGNLVFGNVEVEGADTAVLISDTQVTFSDQVITPPSAQLGTSPTHITLDWVHPTLTAGIASFLVLDILVDTVSDDVRFGTSGAVLNEVIININDPNPTFDDLATLLATIEYNDSAVFGNIQVVGPGTETTGRLGARESGWTGYASNPRPLADDPSNYLAATLDHPSGASSTANNIVTFVDTVGQPSRAASVSKSGSDIVRLLIHNNGALSLTDLRTLLLNLNDPEGNSVFGEISLTGIGSATISGEYNFRGFSGGRAGSPGTESDDDANVGDYLIFPVTGPDWVHRITAVGRGEHEANTVQAKLIIPGATDPESNYLELTVGTDFARGAAGNNLRIEYSADGDNDDEIVNHRRGVGLTLHVADATPELGDFLRIFTLNGTSDSHFSATRLVGDATTPVSQDTPTHPTGGITEGRRRLLTFELDAQADLPVGQRFEVARYDSGRFFEDVVPSYYEDDILEETELTYPTGTTEERTLTTEVRTLVGDELHNLVLRYEATIGGQHNIDSMRALLVADPLEGLGGTDGGTSTATVFTDSTLLGDGSSADSADRLRVASPFTPAEKSKLSGLSPGTVTPSASDRAAGHVGTSDKYAREDHRHPQQDIFHQMDDILSAGSNVTITADSNDDSITIASTASGGGSGPDASDALPLDPADTASAGVSDDYSRADHAHEKQDTYGEAKDIIVAGTNVTVTADDGTETLTIASTATGGSATADDSDFPATGTGSTTEIKSERSIKAYVDAAEGLTVDNADFPDNNPSTTDAKSERAITAFVLDRVPAAPAVDPPDLRAAGAQRGTRDEYARADHTHALPDGLVADDEDFPVSPAQGSTTEAKSERAIKAYVDANSGGTVNNDDFPAAGTGSTTEAKSEASIKKYVDNSTGAVANDDDIPVSGTGSTTEIKSERAIKDYVDDSMVELAGSSDGNPEALGTASRGSSSRAARADHVHALPDALTANNDDFPAAGTGSTTAVKSEAAIKKYVDNSTGAVANDDDIPSTGSGSTTEIKSERAIKDYVDAQSSSFNINTLTAETPVGADELAFYDITNTDERKVTLTDLAGLFSFQQVGTKVWTVRIRHSNSGLNSTATWTPHSGIPQTWRGWFAPTATPQTFTTDTRTVPTRYGDPDGAKIGSRPAGCMGLVLRPYQIPSGSSDGTWSYDGAATSAQDSGPETFIPWNLMAANTNSDSEKVGHYSVFTLGGISRFSEGDHIPLQAMFGFPDHPITGGTNGSSSLLKHIELAFRCRAINVNIDIHLWQPTISIG